MQRRIEVLFLRILLKIGKIKLEVLKVKQHFIDEDKKVLEWLEFQITQLMKKNLETNTKIIIKK